MHSSQYSLGNLIYTIVTGHWPFDVLRPELRKDFQKEMKEMVMGGHRPHVTMDSDDSNMRKSKDPYIQAMLQAMEMCWKQDPRDRASAREVEEFLRSKLPSSIPEAQHRGSHQHGHRHRRR